LENDNLKPDNINAQIPAVILVVEDDIFTRRFLKSMFDSIGREVVFAENGKDGLEIFKAIHPDIVISDYNMPEMNGLEMFSIIRSEAPHAKLVLMTIYTESEVLIDAINLGVDRFLEKPIFKERLSNVLTPLLQDVKLAKEVTKYQNLLNAYRLGVDTSTIFSLLDINGCYTYVNENFCAISGYSRDELNGKHYSTVRKLGSLNDFRYLTMTDRYNEHVWQGCVINVSSDETEYVTEITLFPIYDNNILTGYISIEKDMSTVVSNHKSQLQAFIDADSSIMFAYNKDIRLTLCNKAFLDFFGFKSKKDAFDKKFLLCNHIADRENTCGSDAENKQCESNIINEIIASAASDNITKLILQVPGYDNFQHFTVSCFDLDQRYIGLENLRFVRLNNITELENLRKDELTSAMLASIGKLAAGVTHEINTPLTYIKGNIELLAGEVEDSVPAKNFDEMKDYFDSINDGISRISLIIESMKEVTGEASFEKINYNLYSTFVVAGRMIYNRSKYIAPVYLNGKKLTMDSNPENEVFMAEIAPKMLEQVWIILLNNSLDQLAQTNLTFDEKYIKILINKMSDGKHKVVFSDNGGGIEPKIMNRLFDLFASTKKHNGMGIGLNIAKTIIEKHNGTIKPFNSNDGAVFEIVF